MVGNMSKTMVPVSAAPLYGAWLFVSPGVIATSRISASKNKMFRKRHPPFHDHDSRHPRSQFGKWKPSPKIELKKKTAAIDKQKGIDGLHRE